MNVRDNYIAEKVQGQGECLGDTCIDLIAVIALAINNMLHGPKR